MHLDGSKAEFGVGDPARRMAQHVDVGVHHGLAEIKLGEAELRGRGQREADQSLPRKRKQEHERDGDEKLRLEDEEAEGDACNPAALGAEGEERGGEAGQR